MVPLLPELKISLENDHLVFHGSPAESAGCVLRGVVSLKVVEPCKFKSLRLKFKGVMHIEWKEGSQRHQKEFKEERSLVEHTWAFLAPGHKQHLITAGTHTWPFELPLAGSLPESLHIGTTYYVHYKLKAVGERPGILFSQIAARAPVHVSRYIASSVVDDFLEPIQISSEWTDKVRYDIAVASKLCHIGGVVPVILRLIPLNPKLRVRYLSFTFKEYTTYKARPGHQKTRGRVVHHQRNDQLTMIEEEDGIGWYNTENIPVPDTLRCDSSGDVVKIRHRIKFIMSLENEDGHISELRAALPVVVVAANNEESINVLPTYENSWQSLPYDEQIMIEMLTADHSPSDLIAPPSYQSLSTPVR
ncbi:hypothetical protein BGW37DRAFT_243566 [Umbelopsis sp. PMI_123]|nr:hypothetical protein BGW37DRAFT_243566 [Umbelopsis sp. PMI_123]